MIRRLLERGVIRGLLGQGDRSGGYLGGGRRLGGYWGGG